MNTVDLPDENSVVLKDDTQVTLPEGTEVSVSNADTPAAPTPDPGNSPPGEWTEDLSQEDQNAARDELAAGEDDA